ncbi:MAG: hypothetical protein D6753_04060 [Planctomycetota bacterium]|nr:MAG: hypothetical protein D6753_04060 [Planctomycetota bacterium]
MNVGAGQEQSFSPDNQFGETNPYAAPQSTPMPESSGSDVPVVPTPVEIGSVFNAAFEVWKANLGLLVGVTLIVFMISGVFSAGSTILNLVAEQGEEEVKLAAALGSFMISLISTVVNIFLGIGQTQIYLRLLRGQSAQVGDLFGGGSRFLPTLAVSILFGLAVGVGTVLCIIPGLVVGALFWPCYYLVVDNKSKVIDSFTVAQKIGTANIGTTILLVLLGIGINLLGFLACGVGILFAAPLVGLLWTTAYLGGAGQMRLP